MNYFDLLRIGSPEAIVAVTALLVLLTGSRSVVCSVIAMLGLAGAAAAVLALPASLNLYHGMLSSSPLSSLFKIICLALALVSVLLAREETMPHRGEYLAILLLATIGLMLLAGSGELLMIFIGLELTGLSLYVLTAFDKSSIRSAEAGLKYFLFGSIASAFTLFGLSLVYGMSGATELAGIGRQLAHGTPQPLLAVGVIMTLIGFAFKVAAAPFHLWAPDTYQAAPVPSAAFIASASKVASFVVLGKIVLIAFGPIRGSAEWHAMVAGWSPILAVLAALSIVIGNFVALAQSNLRRLLAYSAVAHAGYTLLGLVAGSADGFSATLFYTTIYAITLLGAFFTIGLVRTETGGDDIANFGGLWSRSPLLAGCMAIFLLSLAGLPPLAGFFGKFYLFTAALHAGANHGLLWLVALALFGSLISLYYYLMVLQTIFRDVTPPALVRIRFDALGRAVVGLLGASVVILGVLPGILLDRILISLR